MRRKSIPDFKEQEAEVILKEFFRTKRLLVFNADFRREIRIIIGIQGALVDQG